MTVTIWEYFCEVETTKEHDGYIYSVGETLTIVILGSVCGLRNDYSDKKVQAFRKTLCMSSAKNCA